MDEFLIAVDAEDRPLHAVEKMSAHREGVLHRAFSVFIFDTQGQVLMPQRALGKYHSPGLWSNSCCGHPRPHEETGAAAERRLYEELGLRCVLQPVAAFLYREAVSEELIEHEYDHVFVGIARGLPRPDPGEVREWRWLALPELHRELARAPTHFTIWLHRIAERFGPKGLRSWRAQAMAAL
ncbi:isopentenyl-diphosphate Delta-isomerase [Variovorax sp. EBFNA2]|uniref:isopentenyl-diphosphate Delta-isomerase n=1 Tax=Variovorax sp. EBFNA2 TaxID=3342097 RepID=UPI0029C0FDC1|nr:isopentenyl-diphosphate Delta-isomerase [Variovorax boronicumulans]WPG36101.1 isopentenyl-diphosphate Delta-isomerase [Variovorax boronicumulans]